MWSPGMFVSRLQLQPVPIADPLPRPCRGAGAGGAGGERRQLAVRDAQPYLARLGGYQTSEVVAEAVVEAEVDARGRRRPRRG